MVIAPPGIHNESLLWQSCSQASTHRQPTMPYIPGRFEDNATAFIAHLRTMARYNAWANARLHTACARLTPEEFTARRVSFFPSLQETLNHILIVDWYYLD